MIREAIFKLVDKQDLTYDEAYDVINEIMSGETTQVQTVAFLSALSTKSTKSETIAEIAGCAAAMRSHATKVDYDKPLLEIVGTGGDKAGSFNISTTAAFKGCQAWKPGSIEQVGYGRLPRGFRREHRAESRSVQKAA